MRFPKTLFVYLLIGLYCPLTFASAQKVPSDDAAGDVQNLGTVNFPTSCSPQVRTTFNKGVALLDSFQYDLSQKVFAEVVKQDPQCGMAYWGEAMSLYHELWMGPNAETIKQGRTIIHKAEELRTNTERERAYIQAVAVYYQDDPKIDDQARARAYSDAMAELYRRFPRDDNAAAFYALSLIAVHSPNQAENMSRRMKAIAILDDLYQAEPNNPGVAHYLIHATDTPELAHLGLNAARAYAKIAPDAPHALHMPSHIFTELGMWQESIDSNLTSASAAEKITKSQVDNESGDQLHALSFLEYAYLQSGRNADARRVIEEVKSVPGASSADIANYETMFEAAYLGETHQWKEAATLVPQPSSYAMAQIQAYAVRAIGEARTGNVAGARTDIDNLRNAFKVMQVNMKGMSMGMMGGGGQNSGESSDELEAEAWLAYAAGKQDEALAKMNAAADRGGSAMRMGGVPAIPAREMLGDLLVEMHRPSEAFAAYVTALEHSPNRFDSLYGAAHAAQLAGNHAAAEHYFAELRRMCRTDADRLELQEAKASAVPK